MDALYEFIGVDEGFVFKGGFLSVTLFQQDLLQELSRGPGRSSTDDELSLVEKVVVGRLTRAAGCLLSKGGCF